MPLEALARKMEYYSRAKHPKVFMRHQRGNPNWGRAMLFAPALPTQFELTVKRLRLTPEMYVSSRELKLWCECNRNRCYVPEWLLKEWHLEVELYYGSGAA
jgi:hypothetical protein